MKQTATLTSLGQIQAELQDSYWSAPLIAVPNGTVTDLSGNVRKIHDPSKILRPLFGFERIDLKGPIFLSKERGPNGDLVFRDANRDERIRYVGSSWQAASTTSGMASYASADNDYMEVTFYGTGLNLLGNFDSTNKNFSASIDGGAYGSDLTPSTIRGLLNGRNYKANMVIPVASNLTLGTHTVRIKNNGPTTDMPCQGLEIINQTTSITVPRGELVNAGKKHIISANTSTAYNSGFDGSPVLNGRGGRVVVYAKGGVVGKVIQQTNATQATLASADHTNEEVIRKINWREFGANRADDFSTLTTGASGRAFTLDNGSTTLMGASVVSGGAGGDSVRGTGAGAFLLITFIGTGLDISTNTNDGNARDTAVTIDGTSIGTFNIAANESARVKKIVSGLPYGTHVVKLAQSGAFDTAFVRDLIIYGPKAPTIPDGAAKIGEYYLMADFVANTTQAVENIATGVMRKAAAREMIYVGASWTAGLTVGSGTTGAVAGFRALGAAAAQTMTYTFFGTGFELRISTPVAVSTFTVSIDGTNPTAAGATATSFYGQFSSFVAGTGVATSNGTGQFANGLRVSGLPLGLHTVVLTQNAATSFGFESIDVITPVHFPDAKRGSLSLNPGIADFPNKLDSGNIDMSKAKAWIVFNGAAGSVEIINSYNISGLFRTATGHYTIYLTKPMKTAGYAIVGTSDRYATGVGQASTLATDFSGAIEVQPKFDHFDVHVNVSGAAAIDTNRASVVVFGEWADEEDL